MRNIIKLLRPKQWIKNLLIFFGLLFSGQWNDLHLLITAMIAFVSFCLMASSLYIFNDLCDRTLDQQHATKRHRPLANGTIRPIKAILLAMSLAFVSLLLISLTSPTATLLVMTYGLLMLAYSKWLKHIPLVDISIVACGFLIRILVGTLGLHVLPNPWLLSCTFILALFLISCKRRAELFNYPLSSKLATTRTALRYYSPKQLDVIIHISATTLLFCYGYYTWQHPASHSQHGYFGLLYTLPIVIAGLGRCYHLLYQSHLGEDLTNDYFLDKIILSLATLWFITLLCLRP